MPSPGFPTKNKLLCSSRRIQDPDRPLEVGLRPTRLVRAKFFQTPYESEYRPLEWQVYAALPGSGEGDARGERLEKGRVVKAMRRVSPAVSPGTSSRLVELRLPEDATRCCFRSSTIERSVDVTVPAGEGAVDLPDIRIESLAWFKMLGGPAAEIDAVDRDAHPVKLADFRGRVVLLAFVDGTYGEGKEIPPLLIALLKSLEKQPLTMLVIHDGSATSLAEFRDKRAPLLDWRFADWHGQIHVALDRPSAKEGAGPDPRAALERSAGRDERPPRTDSFRIPACFVIDKDGRLAFALIEGEKRADSFRRVGEPLSLVMRSSDALAGEADEENLRIEFAAAEVDRALREQLGLSNPPDPDDLNLDIKPFEDYFWKPTVPKGGLMIRGRKWVIAPMALAIARARGFHRS